MIDAETGSRPLLQRKLQHGHRLRVLLVHPNVAWLGMHVAVRKGTVWVRWFVIVIVLVSAGQLLGVFEWVGRLLG